MKLKKYNTENSFVGVKNIVHPKLTICLRSGAIRINAKMVEEAKFKTGDKVAFSQDEEKPENWYLHKDKKGFPLNAHGKARFSKNHSLAFCCKDLVGRLLQCTELKKESGTIEINIDSTPINVEGINFYEIATKTARKSFHSKR